MVKIEFRSLIQGFLVIVSKNVVAPVAPPTSVEFWDGQEKHLEGAACMDLFVTRWY
jgi:hypothetical protein